MSNQEIPSIDVLNEANSYLNAALILEREAEQDMSLFRPACVNAALSIELSLKSFLAKEDLKEAGTISGLTLYSAAEATTYGHDLLKLFSAIKPEYQKAIRRALEKQSPGYPLDRQLLEFKDYFVRGRYGYEHGALGVLRSAVFEFAELIGGACLTVARDEHHQS